MKETADVLCLDQDVYLIAVPGATVATLPRGGMHQCGGLSGQRERTTLHDDIG